MMPDHRLQRENEPAGNMALSNPQLQALKRLAKGPFGCMTRFEFLDEIGDSSARKLLKEGFVIGTHEQGGTIKITPPVQARQKYWQRAALSLVF